MSDIEEHKEVLDEDIQRNHNSDVIHSNKSMMKIKLVINRFNPVIKRFMPLIERCKTLINKNKKISCILMVAILLLVGFAIGRKKPQNVSISFGAPQVDWIESEKREKGSMKNPYHLNEDIVIFAYDGTSGMTVKYTYNLQRVLRESAVNTKFFKNSTRDVAGVVGSIKAEWEGSADVVPIVPHVDLGYQNQNLGRNVWSTSPMISKGYSIDELENGCLYSNLLFEQVSQVSSEMSGYIAISYTSKNENGEIETYVVYVEYDTNIIES